MKEFNFEVYTKNPETGECGWDIKFVSVIAKTKDEAVGFLKTWSLFDVIILFNYSVEVVAKEDNAYQISNTVIGKEGNIFDTDCYINPNQKYILVYQGK